MSGEKNRHFGNIRKLASGRYQARYRGPDGKLRSAQHTFERKSDASRWLSFKDIEITQGEWIAPELAKMRFGEYAEDGMRDRVLKVRTEELYRGLLRNHLLPMFGSLTMADIDEGAVLALAKRAPRGREEGKASLRAGHRRQGIPPATRDRCPRGVVFVGPKGGRLRRSNFRKIWNKVRASVGLPDLHFHDLRYGRHAVGGDWRGLKELMARLGHSSVRAAMIYQHATRDRDQALGALVRDVRQEAAETPEEQPERRESDA